MRGKQWRIICSRKIVNVAMLLTPVHIRGKRKRDPPPTPSSVAAPNTDKAPKKMKRSLASLRASRLSRHRTVLESLPAELLESILLYSENLSLPRSSHLIGAKLSGRATLLRLFMMAFHDTWNQWFGIPKTQLHGPRPKQKEWASFDGDAVFQVRMESLGLCSFCFSYFFPLCFGRAWHLTDVSLQCWNCLG